MAGFVRQFTTVPSIETILEIEGVVVIDIAPPDPVTGAGTGAVLVVGEFEDGFFATDEEAVGAVEIFGSNDLAAKFGGFGFTYDGVKSNNPCARRHLGELWNGNGYLKLYKMRASRIMISRVDTSVGSVSFEPLACQTAGSAGPFALEVGDTLDLETDQGSASSAAIAAAVATVTGSGAAFATVTSGDAFSVQVDGGPTVTVTLGALDVSQAAVIARINSTLGYTAAATATAEISISGIVPGTSGSLVLADVVSGTLAKLGLTAGTTAGTGNVANLNSVTSTELATIINGTAGLTAIQIAADIDPDGRLRICNDVSATASTLRVDPAELGTKLGFPLASLTGTVDITDHPAGTVAAGSRLRASGTAGVEWVTMQTLDIPEGAAGPFTVKVRPALDDGTAAGQAAGTVNTLVDPSSAGALTVNNAAALTAALDENQMDNRYIEALEATLDQRSAAFDANYLVCARRSDAVVRAGVDNAVNATRTGMRNRKFISGDPLGTTISQINANVAKFRNDRLFYTGKGLKVRIPAIAERGLAGGLGFTADGIITVRPDGPLTTINATLNPEENPGQATGLIDSFFAVDSFGEKLTEDAYKAFKRNGVCVPRNDRQSGMVFQSGVTSSLESGRTTQARRKFADFIQDTLDTTYNPYVKKMSVASRRQKLLSLGTTFLQGLEDAERITGFVASDGVDAGNTADVLAKGVYFMRFVVKTNPSLDDIVIQTEVGENAVISTDL